LNPYWKKSETASTWTESHGWDLWYRDEILAVVRLMDDGGYFLIAGPPGRGASKPIIETSASPNDNVIRAKSDALAFIDGFVKKS